MDALFTDAILSEISADCVEVKLMLRGDMVGRFVILRKAFDDHIRSSAEALTKLSPSYNSFVSAIAKDNAK